MIHFVLTISFALCLAFELMPQQPSDLTSQFNRAAALQRQGKLDEAAAEYRAVIKLKPDYTEAHANLGVVLARLGKYNEAIDAYETALRLNPNLTPIKLNLGIAHYRAGQFAKAVEALNSFLERQPDSAQARQLLGISLVELGRDQEAIKQLEMNLLATSQDAAALYSLGLAYLRLEKPELRWAIEQLEKLSSGRPASHLLKGQAFLAGREYERAIAELQAAGKLNPELPKLNYSLGLAAQQLGRNKEALAAFEAELRRSPQDRATLYYLAYVNEAAGNLEAAGKHLAELLKFDSESAEVNALQGKILFKQGKAAEAVKPLEKAATKKSGDHELRYLLARVYQQLGRREDAAREFAEVQKLKAEQLKKDRANSPKP